MTITPESQRDRFDVSLLHPIMIGPVSDLIRAMRAHAWNEGAELMQFEPFEGYRSPMRQRYLRTTTKSTKAGPWQSSHQYGLAVDFAVSVYEKGLLFDRWTWPDTAPWDVLKREALRVGLTVPIAWDRGHVQHPRFVDVRTALA